MFCKYPGNIIYAKPVLRVIGELGLKIVENTRNIEFVVERGYSVFRSDDC